MSNKPTNFHVHGIKGRGAQSNPSNQFSDQVRNPTDIEYLRGGKSKIKTTWIETQAKTIINEVKSADIGLNYSVNPYQGCEHGCSYCYARNTHNYWGYSAGLDFESKILVKKNAARLLEDAISKKSWGGEPIMLSGNTDCYQPAEKELKITRQILEVLWKYKNPVGVISKNMLMLRDLDILRKMAESLLLRCSVSLNTLDDGIRQKLEPRASSVHSRLKLIKNLSKEGIPVNVMIAPIIPSINHHEIHSIMEEVSSLGALDARYIIVRLNGHVETIFTEWLHVHFPDRASKVLNQIRELHGGKLGNSRFGKRMKGEGKISEIIRQQYELARRCFFADRKLPEFNLDLFHQQKNPQLSLF